jgi:hypothetical protein
VPYRLPGRRIRKARHRQPGDAPREHRPPRDRASVDQSRSRMVTFAWPPPSHIVCRP